MWADPFFMHMTWPGREQDTLVRIHLIHHEVEFTNDFSYTLSVTTKPSGNTLVSSNSAPSTLSPKARILCNGRKETCSCISQAAGREVRARSAGISSGQREGQFKTILG